MKKSIWINNFTVALFFFGCQLFCMEIPGLVNTGINLLSYFCCSQEKKDKDLLTYCFKGNVLVVRILLKLKANVHTQDSLGVTPLMRAAIAGNETIFFVLLAAASDLFAKDTLNRTVLMHTARSNSTRLVDFCIKKGLSINDKSTEQWMAVHYAALNGRDKVLKFLIENGADVNVCNTNNRSPSMYAAKQGHVSTLKILKQAGANFEARDRKGKTVLSLACEFNEPEAAINILSQINTVTWEDEGGMTPLMYLADHNDTAAVPYLLLWAEPQLLLSQCNNDGHTAVDIARTSGSYVVEALLPHNVLREKGMREAAHNLVEDFAQSKGKKGKNLTSILRKREIQNL